MIALATGKYTEDEVRPIFCLRMPDGGQAEWPLGVFLMPTVARTGAFEMLTDAKYLTSPDYLLNGDVLVNEARHTVMVLSNGERAGDEREVVEWSKIIVDGKEIPVERILKNGTNYVKVRDIAAALDLNVSFRESIAVLSRKA